MPRKVLKYMLVLLAGLALAGICLYGALPLIISSPFFSESAAGLASSALGHQIAVKRLSFSWDRGLDVTGCSIRRQDGSEVMDLDRAVIAVSWLSLLTGKINVRTLSVDGAAVTITRSSEEKKPQKPRRRHERKALFSLSRLPPVSFTARFDKTALTVIDNRLKTAVRIYISESFFSVPSLSEPVACRLKGTVALDNKAPDPVEAVGNITLASNGTFNPWKARGSVSLRSGFGSLQAEFDLAGLSAARTAAGNRLTCTLDLEKLFRTASAIAGLPAGFSLAGTLHTVLEARGSAGSGIAVTGRTHLREVTAAGGPSGGLLLDRDSIAFSQDIFIKPGWREADIRELSWSCSFCAVTASGTISGLHKKPRFRIGITGSGELARAEKIITTLFSPAPGFRTAGKAAFDFTASGTAASVQIDGAIDCTGLKLWAAAMGRHPISEKSLRIQPDINLSLPDGKLVIRALAVSGSALRGSVSGSINGQDVDMNIHLQTDLSVLKQQAMHLSPSFFPVRGTYSADVVVGGGISSVYTLSGDHSLKDAVFRAPSAQPENTARLALSRLEVHHEASLDTGAGSIMFTKLTGTSPFLTVRGSGNVSAAKGPLRGKMSIEATLDMEKGARFLGGLLPEQAQFRGSCTASVNAASPPPGRAGGSVLSSWSGDCAVSLEEIRYRGVGTVKNLRTEHCSFEKGVVTVSARGLLNQGPARLQGTIDLNTAQPTVTCALSARNVRLSRDISILGYVVPLLIMSPSGNLSGKAAVNLTAAWRGTGWERDISRSLDGTGDLTLTEGAVSSRNVVSLILRHLDTSPAIRFEKIFTSFTIRDAKLYNDAVQVQGNDVSLGFRGWTSLVRDPALGGNPMQYEVTGSAFDRYLGRDARKIFELLKGDQAAVPLMITGTVQKPKVTLRVPGLKNIF